MLNRTPEEMRGRIMRSHLLVAMTMMSLMDSSLPARADSLVAQFWYPSAASGGSWSWKHILVITLTVVGFLLVVFFALGLPTIREAMREGRSEARADPLYQRIRRSLKRRAARRDADR